VSRDYGYMDLRMCCRLIMCILFRF